MADDRQKIIEEFDEAVNMTPKQLEEWLEIPFDHGRRLRRGLWTSAITSAISTDRPALRPAGATYFSGAP